MEMVDCLPLGCLPIQDSMQEPNSEMQKGSFIFSYVMTIDSGSNPGAVSG